MEGSHGQLTPGSFRPPRRAGSNKLVIYIWPPLSSVGRARSDSAPLPLILPELWFYMSLLTRCQHMQRKRPHNGAKTIVGDVNPETYMRFGNLGICAYTSAAYVSYIPS